MQACSSRAYFAGTASMARGTRRFGVTIANLPSEHHRARSISRCSGAVCRAGHEERGDGTMKASTLHRAQGQRIGSKRNAHASKPWEVWLHVRPVPPRRMRRVSQIFGRGTSQLTPGRHCESPRRSRASRAGGAVGALFPRACANTA